MRERIRILRARLLTLCRQHEERMRCDTHPRQATYSFVSRAKSIDRAIWLLLDNESVPEAAILLRSQINLLWCFLFMVDARSVDGRFEFEREPQAGSNFAKRAARYLSWHWIDLHRRNPSAQSREMFDRLVQEHGFDPNADIPRYWYQEGSIRNIRHLAENVGGQNQYDEDYSHLSGVEHSDVTSVIVEKICDARYGDFIALKSAHVFAAVMDFAIKICEVEADANWERAIQEFNTLADDIAHRAEHD